MRFDNLKLKEGWGGAHNASAPEAQPRLLCVWRLSTNQNGGVWVGGMDLMGRSCDKKIVN